MKRFRCWQRLGWMVIAGVLLVAPGCKRKSRATSSSGAGGPEGQEVADAPVASALADPSAAAAPLPPPGAELTVAVERRFIPVQPVNAYAPATPGDYQAQLDLYNRVLKKWTINASWTPSTLHEIMASFGTPKPPQPPSGRTLVYDKATVSVRLQ